ncbi:MAG TPA: MATE family efflux transporter, partial [Lachnospiraceae bacterium]|nr:MATE family efflux transporter [Lachnospiraceae bacterium]
VILDYVFVGRPGYGIKGIAYASLLTGAVSLLLLLCYILFWSKVYKFCRFRFDAVAFRNTIFNGSSEFIGEMSMCITMYAYNIVILKNVGVDGVTAFTIVGYVSYLFSMIIVGFGQGCVPLLSFVHGAGDRFTELAIRRLTNLCVLLCGIVLIVLMFFLATPYSHAFVDSIEIQQMVAFGTRIHVLSFLFAGINTIASFYFTSISKAKESAIISFLRGILILLICILTLPHFFGMTGVWLIAPINEAVTVIVSILFLLVNDRSCKLQDKIVT